MAENLNLNYGIMELSLKMSSIKFIFPKNISQNIVVLPYAFSFIFSFKCIQKDKQAYYLHDFFSNY